MPTIDAPSSPPSAGGGGDGDSSSSDAHQTKPPPPRPGIDFESLPWNLNEPGAHRYIRLTTSDVWTVEHYDAASDAGLATGPSSVHPYDASPLPLYPAATSLNYGTTIWEGLKCYRRPDGRAAVFRPDRNWHRFRSGAEAMCLPAPSYGLFMRCVQRAVVENADLIPPCGDGMKLYIRPMLLGSGQQLGLHPSAEFTLLFFVSPTGNYFKGKTRGLSLHLETNRSRAARGGTGNVKCAGNYAVTLRPLVDASGEGFDDNLYLELDTYDRRTGGGLEDAVVQEMSAANVFLVLRSGEIVTPSLDRGTVLPGVTRDSILALAREFADELRPLMAQSLGAEEGEDLGIPVTVSERDVSVSDLRDAVEAFATGTAAEVVPLASVSTASYDAEEFRVEFPHGHTLPGGPVTAGLLRMLREVMFGVRTCDATSGWVRDPFGSVEEFRALEP